MGNERKAALIHFDSEPDRYGSNVTLPKSLWAALERISEEETKKRQKAGHKGQVSRNHVIENALEFFVTMYNQKERK